jgi:hypothetical protein
MSLSRQLWSANLPMMRSTSSLFACTRGDRCSQHARAALEAQGADVRLCSVSGCPACSRVSSQIDGEGQAERTG